MTNLKPLRAIDLYSGVGGWSLGLRLAGIEVVSSFELWGPANETNFKNNAHQAQTVDIRRLSLEDLPSDIDLVVGSPPCTQFSYSNRGGGGDLLDGLEDIRHFLRIVAHLRPRLWAMENVPRVAGILKAALVPGGALEEFVQLGCATHLVDMSSYGVPQRRRRCIAGNFDIDLLKSYAVGAPQLTLGDIVLALSGTSVTDPLYGVTLPQEQLTDHTEETPLSPEETRINRANKQTHTVYNAMPFPDPLNRTVRTITATCTRVSRESIVISPPERPGLFRRLTLRERACLQGFPITFQFYGTSYSQKLRMIGNAVPPAFSYLMGHVLQGSLPSGSPRLRDVGQRLVSPTPLPSATAPDRVGSSYPLTRTFRFAIPSLQLKSGVRFELSNTSRSTDTSWHVGFYFGNSKSIQTLALDAALAGLLTTRMSVTVGMLVRPELEILRGFIGSSDITNMQSLWAHKGPGGTRAFDVLDKLDEYGTRIARMLSDHPAESRYLVELGLRGLGSRELSALPGIAKLARNAPLILAGMLIGSTVNTELAVQSRGPETSVMRYVR